MKDRNDRKSFVLNLIDDEVRLGKIKEYVTFGEVSAAVAGVGPFTKMEKGSFGA